MSIRKSVVRVTTTGSAGSATGNADSEVIVGEVLALHVEMHASAPATMDIDVVAKNPADYTIWARDNSAADAFISPRDKLVDNANAAITNAHAPFPVAGKINVALAQADALTNAAVVTIFWRD